MKRATFVDPDDGREYRSRVLVWGTSAVQIEHSRGRWKPRRQLQDDEAMSAVVDHYRREGYVIVHMVVGVSQGDRLRRLDWPADAPEPKPCRSIDAGGTRNETERNVSETN